MLAFGIGAALPLLLLGFASRETIQRWRGKMLTGGKAGKMLMGAALLVIGLAILTGFDKTLETALTQAAPSWLVDITTRF
jgi:sulfite exporter TauE/SafE